MKNHYTQLALIATAILLFSCGKDINPEKNTNKVKSYTENISSANGSLSVTYNLSYDADNRITVITPSNAPESKIVFSYLPNDTYSMELYNADGVEIHLNFFMHNSLLDSTIQYNVSKDSISEKYYYDSGDRLVSKKEYEYYSGPYLTNTIKYNYDAVGNMIKSTDTDGNMDTFEYYSDLVYAMPVIAPFFTNTKKSSLIKSHTLTSYGRIQESTVSTYTFDGSNRISTVTETSDNGIIVTKTFSYF